MNWKKEFPELVAESTTVDPCGPAVYFLVRYGKIVYIGSSVYPSERVKNHRCSKRKFTSVFFVRSTIKRLRNDERKWIDIVVPQNNSAHNLKRKAKTPGWGGRAGVKMLPISSEYMKILEAIHKRTGCTYGNIVQQMIEIYCAGSGTLHPNNWPDVIRIGLIGGR